MNFRFLTLLLTAIAVTNVSAQACYEPDPSGCTKWVEPYNWDRSELSWKLFTFLRLTPKNLTYVSFPVRSDSWWVNRFLRSSVNNAHDLDPWSWDGHLLLSSTVLWLELAQELPLVVSVSVKLVSFSLLQYLKECSYPMATDPCFLSLLL